MRLIVTLPRATFTIRPFFHFFNLMLVAAGLVALFGISSVFNQGVVALGKKKSSLTKDSWSKLGYINF